MAESEQGTAHRTIGRLVEKGTAKVQSGSGSTPAGSDRDTAVRSGSSSTPKSTGSSADRAGGRRAAKKVRQAQLRLVQVDAWSVMKTAFLLSIAMGIVTVVAVAVVWGVLGAAGVFDSLNQIVQTIMGNRFKVQDYIGTGRVLGFTMLVAVVNVVLLTAIATLLAFLYNLAATLLGGIEVTLAEDG